MDEGKCSPYKMAKFKRLEQDYELASLKKKLKPTNAVRLVGNKVQNYEEKELQFAQLQNKELVSELNKLAFEVKQKDNVFN